MSGFDHINAEAFRQGQRDREQGWPELSRCWEYEGWALHAYMHGFEHPRIDPKRHEDQQRKGV